MRTNRIRFNDPSNYEFLGYDAHGGSTLEVPEALIDRARFNEPPPLMAELDAERMAAFARFARYLRTNNVDLLVLCSPYRDGLRTPDTDREAQAFVTMLENIVRPMGHELVNGYEARWSDDLYCDASHFDHAGAEAFTRWCLSRTE
jgi:hypothetical protein